jgi:hypothetical protein
LAPRPDRAQAQEDIGHKQICATGRIWPQMEIKLLIVIAVAVIIAAGLDLLFLYIIMA